VGRLQCITTAEESEGCARSGASPNALDIVLSHDPGEKLRDEVTVAHARPMPELPPLPECSAALEGAAEGSPWQASTYGSAASLSEGEEGLGAAAAAACLLDDTPSASVLASSDSTACPSFLTVLTTDEPDPEPMKTSRLDRATRVQKLRCFLATSGFRSVNHRRKTGLPMMTSHVLYPLHAAVRANDTEVILALLWAGADRSKTDSQQLTALALARKLNRNGSHDDTIRILSSELAARKSATIVRRGGV